MKRVLSAAVLVVLFSLPVLVGEYLMNDTGQTDQPCGGWSPPLSPDLTYARHVTHTNCLRLRVNRFAESSEWRNHHITLLLRSTRPA